MSENESKTVLATATESEETKSQMRRSFDNIIRNNNMCNDRRQQAQHRRCISIEISFLLEEKRYHAQSEQFRLFRIEVRLVD